MTLDLYSFSNYRNYIEKFIDTSPNNGRGQRTKIAEVMNVKVSYVSRILQEKADLSMEQALSLGKYFQYDHDEMDYFLLLVNYARAGSKSLQIHLKEKIKKIQNERMQLKNQLVPKRDLTEKEQAQYFSNLDNALVHLSLTLPNVNTADDITNKINIPRERVAEILKMLVQLQLVKKDIYGNYETLEQRLFLPSDSSIISNYHAQRRMQVIPYLNHSNDIDLHYSSTISISKEDFLEIKKVLVKALESARTRIKDSGTEQLCGFNLDFYRITNEE